MKISSHHVLGVPKMRYSSAKEGIDKVNVKELLLRITSLAGKCLQIYSTSSTHIHHCIEFGKSFNFNMLQLSKKQWRKVVLPKSNSSKSWEKTTSGVLLDNSKGRTQLTYVDQILKKMSPERCENHQWWKELTFLKTNRSPRVHH